MAIQIKKRKILVIKSRAIGDTILMTGPLRILRQHFPDHEIHVLVRAPAGQLLEGLPYVDRIFSSVEPKGKIDRLAYWMRLVNKLRDFRYDFSINLHASFRSSLTAKFLRTNKCVANHHELNGRNWFSDFEVPGRGQVKSIIDRDLDTLRAFGIQASVADAMPEIILSPAEKRNAAKIFDDAGIATSPRIFLGIGGSRATKRWPASHFAELAKKMIHELGAHIVLATIDIDLPFLEELLPLLESENEKIFHVHGKTLRESAQIISQCQLYVGNDSGLKHLAVALGLKTFTFFGPEAPLEWHPYPLERHPYAFIENLVCRTESGKHWCSIAQCHAHQHKCMRQLSVDIAFPLIKKLFEGKS